jgi:MoxR-like ATPase
VTFDDVRALAHPVLRHRILLNFQAQSEKVTTDQLVEKLLAAVPIPKSAL